MLGIWARWARRLSWKEVAEVFHTSWEKVFRSVEMAVEWGRAHQDLSGVGAIGIDEVAWQRGPRFLTLVYQIDEGCRRLLWVGKERAGKNTARLLLLVRPRTQRRASLHLLGHVEAVPDGHRQESGWCHSRTRPLPHHGQDEQSARRGAGSGVESACGQGLRAGAQGHAAGCCSNGPENLTEKQEPKLAELLRYNLRSVRAYLLKEDFQFFWDYISPYWAGQFLDRWCTRTMRSKIEPMKKMARTLRAHRPLLLNWFRAKGAVSAATVEGFNCKGETDPEKILRIQNLQSHGNRLVSYTWRFTLAQIHPQILLTSQILRPAIR